MLDSQQHEYVKERFYCSDHDYFYETGLRGEPFLEHNVLHYFDGEIVSLVGYLLDRSLEGAAALDRIGYIASTYLEFPSVQSFHYYGPWKLDLSRVLGDRYFLIYADDQPDPYNVSMFVDLTDSSVLKTRNAKESARKARRRQLDLSIGSRSFLTHDHIALIRHLATRDLLGLSDVSFLTNVISILRSNVTTFFEARADQRLVGFAVSHEFFEGKPCLVLVCTDSACRDVSDALYVTIINHFRERGAERLDLGYSVNQGIYQYKIKWGGVYCNLPYYQFAWTRESPLTRSSDDVQGHLHWVCRLLLSKAQSVD